MCNERKPIPQSWNATDKINAMERHCEDGTLNFKVQSKHYSIPLDDIIYLEKKLRLISVHTKKGCISFYGRFIDVVPLLDERFTHCHKSYVLNMDEIICLSRAVVVMSDDVEIRFGKRSYDRLMKNYTKWEEKGLTTVL